MCWPAFPPPEEAATCAVYCAGLVVIGAVAVVIGVVVAEGAENDVFDGVDITLPLESTLDPTGREGSLLLVTIHRQPLPLNLLVTAMFP
jgi:hypothetical protein